MRAMGRGATLAALLVLGCAGPWQTDDLELRYPALESIRGHRLGDVTPYLLPARGELVYFLCRWPDGAEIPVTLPDGATDSERIDIERALRAWEGAGLGLRFGAAEPGRGIEMRFSAEEIPDARGARAATAVADCSLDASALGDPTVPVLDARISYASILLSRRGRDAVGREVAWSRPERLGALLHELGHALGFQGHLRRGDGVMAASVDRVRRAGQRLLDGEPFEDATLRALYALPSGVVVGRAQVGARRTDPVERMAALARHRGLVGPVVQVGDRAGRLVWYDEAGTSFALKIWNLDEVLRRPGALALFPEPRAADLLRARRRVP